jgi:class 3 adenylate cyclase/CHASE2 domain-containing sensor protein
MIKILMKTWAVYLTLIILLGIYISNPILLQSAKLNTFDFYQTFGKNYESKSLVLVDISDKALKKNGQWPWKRDILGRTIINAYKNGAALVVLQVVFPHKDRLGGDEMFLKMISKYPVILTETDTVKNLISISRKAIAIGNVSVPVDIDGTIRKLPLDKSIPEVILKIINAKTSAEDTIWIDFRHHIPRIDFTDNDWSSVKGKIVFIGTTFKGSTFVTTPNGLKNTHEIMAISTETLLSGNYISRPYWLPYGELAFIILGALFFLIVIPRCGVMWSAIWYVGYLFDLTLASSYLWTQHLIITDWFSPLVIGSIIWGQLTYNNYSKENKLRLQIKKQFEHYLSPDMVKKLQKDPSLLKLGGERKELTFMFSDIRGFTPISESMKDDPEKLTRYVNKFLTAMTTIILKNGGTIDKYMGDCIMAFWNAPLDCKNHRVLAVKTALEMETKLNQMNKNGEFVPPLKIGIGLNTGDCLVGNMGSEQRFDYSVIGDAVNLASRLEGLSKNYDTTIIVNKDTADGIDYIPMVRPKGFKFEKLDDVLVKGKKEKISIFSVH